MSIANSITFKGRKYNLDDRDKVAALAGARSGYAEQVKVVHLEGTVLTQNAETVHTTKQPGGTLLTGITLVCLTAPVTAASVSIGVEIGNTSSGAELCSNSDVVDNLIDVGTDGTDMAVGAVFECTQPRKTLDAVTLAADEAYASAERDIFVTFAVDDNAVTTQPKFALILKYVDLNVVTSDHTD